MQYAHDTPYKSSAKPSNRRQASFHLRLFFNERLAYLFLVINMYISRKERHWSSCKLLTSSRQDSMRIKTSYYWPCTDGGRQAAGIQCVRIHVGVSSWCLNPQSTHKVATTAFWHAFHHDGKISPGGWGWRVRSHPLSLYLPSRTKVQFTLQQRGQVYPPYFISTLYVLCACISEGKGKKGGPISGL